MNSSPVILVVEDDPGALRVVVRTLEHSGFKVLAAPSAETARDLAQHAQVDLILSDVNMPGERGPHMANSLKAAGVDCPVLFMSGEHSYEALDESLHVPGATFIPKPFSPAELVQAVFETLAPR